MTTRIQIRELPDRLDELLALASSGHEVVLLEGTTARARLVPYESSGPRTPGLHAGALQPAPDFDASLPDDFWVSRS